VRSPVKKKKEERREKNEERRGATNLPTRGHILNIP
jgi:hypothetical protein